MRFKGNEMRVWVRLNLLNYLELERNGYLTLFLVKIIERYYCLLRYFYPFQCVLHFLYNITL